MSLGILHLPSYFQHRLYSTMMDLNNNLSLGLGIIAIYVDICIMQNFKK
jgi:hypothetical protein